MKLVVERTDGLPSVEYETLQYLTNEEGELDVLDDDGVVIATHNRNKWSSVSRVKDEDEEWPAYVLETREENGRSDGGEGGFPGFPGLTTKVGLPGPIPREIPRTYPGGELI